ncbi:MAG: hypothetical protein WCH62_05190 [Candidatus Omnitrophota bacterium]
MSWRDCEHDPEVNISHHILVVDKRRKKEPQVPKYQEYYHYYPPSRSEIEWLILKETRGAKRTGSRGEGKRTAERIECEYEGYDN